MEKSGRGFQVLCLVAIFLWLNGGCSGQGELVTTQMLKEEIEELKGQLKAEQEIQNEFRSKLSAYDTLMEKLQISVDSWVTDPFKGQDGDQKVGQKGDPGPVGQKGDPGTAVSVKGDRGFPGLEGPQGIRGLQGMPGSQGMAGNQGPAGSQGMKGQKGDIGLTGSKGERGFTGSPGPQGPPGINAPTSLVGEVAKLKKELGLLSSRSESCGGWIELNEERELIYRVPRRGQPVAEAAYCIWVVWATTGDAIAVSILDSDIVQYQPTLGSLKVSCNYSITNSRHRELSSLGPHRFNFPFVILMYHSQPMIETYDVRGFHARLTPSGSHTLSTSWLVSHLWVEAKTESLTYSSLPYQKNERRFIIVTPLPGQKLTLTMHTFETEENYDWLEMSVFNNNGSTAYHLRMHGSANASYLQSKSYTGGINKPVVLYFHSDGSTQKNGFSFSYTSTS